MYWLFQTLTRGCSKDRSPILSVSPVTRGPPDPNSNLAGGRTAGMQDEIKDPPFSS